MTLKNSKNKSTSVHGNGNDELQLREANARKLATALREATFVTPATLYDKSLTGGQRSLLNKARITAESKIGAHLKVPATHLINDIVWRQPGYSIERESQLIWHAGHASAILATDPVTIVAAETGGVWLVNHYGIHDHPATPLSDEWDNPDVECLAYAPGTSSSFYAGCGGAGALYFVDLQPVLGGMEPRTSAVIPLPFYGSVLQIVVLEGSRRIVLATGNGIWWTNIPASPGNIAGYNWHQATQLPFGTYSGLAEGPGESIVAAAWGAEIENNHYGIFRGRWEGGSLVFTRSTISGTDQTKMLRTSLTSSLADRSVLYAASAAADEGLLALLASTDGGASWKTVSKPDAALTGYQGSCNNVIAASPLRPKVVVFGWRPAGHFISTDGGLNWTQTNNGDSNLHGDLHALYFARNNIGVEWLFSGSDGSITNTRDLGQTYDSQHNKELGTIQFYSNTLTVSSRFPGLMAGGTQDNGNIYYNPLHENPSWRILEGGDGGINRFIDSLGSLLRYNNTLTINDVEVGNRVRIDFWNAATESFSGLGTVVPVDGDAGGLQTPFIEVVRTPVWGRNGKLMYAVAATMSAGKVYGFFAKADGSEPTLTSLVDIGDAIGSIASRDGKTVLIGTQTGRIVKLDCASGSTTDLVVSPAYKSGSFTRLADISPTRAFALHSSTQMLHYDGSAWNTISGAGYVAFEVDPQPGSRRVFAATASSVYLSLDDGATWANASKLLPAMPHCSDLRLAEDGKGGHDLYLATYGRSVWKAKVDYTEQGPDFSDVPSLVGTILVGVLNGGAGLELVGGHIRRVPPRQAIVDLLTAVAIGEVARSMSNQAGREIRAAALGTIRNIADKELGELGQH